MDKVSFLQLSPQAAGPPSRRSSSRDIPRRIERNRQKRLAIAEAMKREAGVAQHHVNHEDLSGLAWIGTGRILSPEGRKMTELATVAHECGHIYLHSDREGMALPTHVMEMEAESYAYQAFLMHGMTMSKKRTEWGRQYVAHWIEKDRAAGIPIDPRALAYAAGLRSPCEPLRKVPFTWRNEQARAALAYEIAVGAKPGTWLEIENPNGSGLPSGAPRPPERAKRLMTIIGRALSSGFFWSWVVLAWLDGQLDPWGEPRAHPVEWREVVATLLTASILAMLVTTIVLAWKMTVSEAWRQAHIARRCLAVRFWNVWR